ncbi:cytochrome P450 [Amycolatopsis sp. GM8]|uniref:cytochrome P450 n=1 Tax=Amycolatopsis sp. GM8 TaxID=2896530 RepID=UPI001F295CAC|nr:cytochrome P450 [Amycolatopsis sp. GM8]
MTPAELALALQPLSYFNTLADRGAGLIEIRTQPQPRILVSDPKAIGAIWQTDRTLQHPGSRSFRPVLGEHSLIWMDGDRHRDYRKVLNGPLARDLDTYRAMIAGIIDQSIATLTAGTEVPLADWTRTVAMRVMSTFVFGTVDDEVVEPFTHWMDQAIGSRPRTLAYRYLRGGLPTADQQLNHALVRHAKRAADRDPRTLAAHLLAPDGPLAAIRDGDRRDQELRDQLVTLLFAGHETTASTAAWALVWLHRYPDIAERVRAELSHVPDDGIAPGSAPLLHAVISETLRLTPPVPAAGTRRLTEARELGTRRFAAGTIVTPHIYVTHRRPAVFNQPQRFDPHRFLDARGRFRRPPIDEYFPFGGGSRRCPGAQLGQLEVAMILIRALRHMDLEMREPRGSNEQLRGHTMAPSPRVRLRVLAKH